MSQLLSVGECAKKLSLSEVAVRRLLRGGHLTKIYPTPKRGCIRIVEEEVEILIQQNRESLKLDKETSE